MAAIARMTTFTRDGLVFDVRDAGPVDGSPVVLLHGFPRTHAVGMRSACYCMRVDAGPSRLISAASHRGLGPARVTRTASRNGRRTSLSSSRPQVWGRCLWSGTTGGPLWRGKWRPSGRICSGRLAAMSVPHPGAFARSMLTSRQVLKSWYLVFFQLPWLPEQEVSSGGSWQHLLRWTGMSAEAAARDAELMRDRGAARGALNWYRAMMFSSPLALRTKITVPTLYLWSDGDTAIGPTGAALTPRFVAGPYTPAELDALPARHFDAYPAPGR